MAGGVPRAEGGKQVCGRNSPTAPAGFPRTCCCGHKKAAPVQTRRGGCSELPVLEGNPGLKRNDLRVPRIVANRAESAVGGAVVYAGIVVKEYVHVRDIEIHVLVSVPESAGKPGPVRARYPRGSVFGAGDWRFVPCSAEADYEVFVKFRIVVEPDRNSGDILPVFMDGFAADGLPRCWNFLCRARRKRSSR